MKQLKCWASRVAAFAALFSILSCFAQAATPPEVVKGQAWLQAQVLADGTLANEAVSIATPLQNRAESLQTFKLLVTVPTTLADQLAADGADNTEYLARRAATLSLAGRDASAIIAQLTARQNANGGFGGNSAYDSSALDTALVMLALAQNAQASTPAAQNARTYLIASIQADGGVGTGSDTARINANALALLALQMYPQDLNTANALKQISGWLLLKQGADGSWLGNSYLTALSLAAVSPLITDPTISTNARTYLVGLQGTDGSWGSGDPFLTAVVLRALAQGTTATATATSSITGQVNDQNTATALAGATVTLGGAATATLTTGTNGSINFPNLAAGSYTLQIGKAGYTTYTSTYQLNASQTLNLGTIALGQVLATGIVTGKITAAATGLPLSGVTVTLNGATTAVTDATGQYTFASVTPGAVTLSASLAGYATSSGSGNVLGGQTMTFSTALYASGIAVPTTGQFTGKVSAAGSGTPLAGVSIVLNGTAAGVTAADGSFNLTLAPASYTAAFTLAGYNAATSTFLLPAGTTVNAGTVSLAPQLTVSTISGTVKDATTGNPINAAQVQVLGGQVVTTGTNGAYTLSGLPGTSFSLRVSATGYVSQAMQLTVSQPSNISQDFPLAVQTGLGLSLGPVMVSPGSAASRAQITASTVVNNAATGSAVSGVLTMEVSNAQGKVIGKAIAYDSTGTNMLAVFNLNPGQQLPVQFKWNSGQFPPGMYTMVAKVLAAGTVSQTAPLGQVLATGQGTLSIVADQHFAGSVAANPPVLQVNTNTPVQLSAILVNDGNTDLPAQAYQLQITNVATGAVVATQQVNGVAFSPNALQSLTFANWLPAAGGGNFSITIQAVATPSMGQVVGKVYVGDAATAAFTVNKLAVPPGTQAVKGNIHVAGQDATLGTVSDPLAPMIKTAIQNAVAYNDKTASQWIVTNGCSGCHVGAQALVGGEMNLKIAPNFDPTQRNIIFNQLASAQNADGSITPSPAHINTFVQAQTYLTLWGLNSWHAKQDIAGTLVKAANYTIGKQDYSGLWGTDYPYGWWYSNMINTGLNTKNLVDVATLIQQTPASLLPTIDTVAPLLPNAQGEGAVMDAAGNLYVTNASVGTLSLVKPDGTVVTLLSGLSVPRPPAFGADGALYIPSDGGVIKYTLAGQATTLTTTPVSSVALGPDGNIYASACWTQKILQITQAGVVSVYLSGGPLWYPVGITFDQSGALLAVQWYGDILKFNPDKTYRTVAYASYGNGLSLLQTTSGDWLVGTTRGLFRYNSAWQLQSTVSSNQTVYLYQAPDGRVLLNGSTTANPYTIFYLTKGPLVSTPMLDASISKAANWMLNDGTANAGDNIELAFRLIGLGEAKKYFAGTPMAATLQTKMDQVGAVLRSHQLPDGGWTHGCYWVNNWWGPSMACSSGSDSMVTAQVGMALDYLNPAPTDPVVQNAVRLLLSRQQPDGSWISENNVLSTHLAATTWVAIWLPIALDRISGIDTDMTVSMPGNVTLSNPSIAPNSSTANAAGGMDYLWHLPGVKSAGVDVSFDLGLSNMVLGENRPVASNAYLTFNNTFTNQPTNSPIAIPRVTASAFLGLGVTTDQTNYGANTPVNITAAVNNTSTTGPLDGSVRLEIYGADNMLAAVVGTQPFTGLPAGAQTSLTATWGTGSIAAGGYYVLATLYDAQNRQVGTAKSVFNIVSGIGTVPGAFGVGAKITTDKPAYLPFDRVQIADRITNLTQNQVQSGLQAVVTIYRPDGTVLWTQTAPLQQLLAGAYIDLPTSAQLNNAPAGQYRAALSVQTTTAAEVAHSETTFAVLSSAITGAGLKGTIGALPKVVPQTDPVVLNWTVSDLGNADFVALPVTVSIIDPVTLQTMLQQPSTVAVLQGQTYQTAFNWATDNANVGSTYIAILSATVGGKTIVLAQDNFLVTEPPVRLDVTQSTVRENRVLVWLTCKSEDNQKAADNNASANQDAARTTDQSGNSGQTSGDGNHAGDDKTQPAVPACIKARTAYLQTLLGALNVPYLITNNRDDFRNAFREGKYNVYWLSGDIGNDNGRAAQDPNNKDGANKDGVGKNGAGKDGRNKDGANKGSDGDGLFKEIREAVNRGDGLILDGAQHVDALQEAAGLVGDGQFPQANLSLATTGLIYPAATLPTQGAAQKLLAATGASQANFIVPANGDDQHSNDHPNSDGQQSQDAGQNNAAQNKDGQQKRDAQQKNDGQHSNTQPGDGHQADDAHKPAPVWPAIISNTYGRGRALTFGFDLVDTLQNSAMPAAWSTELQTGLTWMLPPLPDTYSAGAYVELGTSIQNLARSVDLAVSTQLPAGITLLQSTPIATLDSNGQPSWLFNLPAAATQPLLLTMRLPSLTGKYTARTFVNSIRNGKTRLYGEYDYNWSVAASDPLAVKLTADLNALLLKSEEEIEARDRAVAQLQRAAKRIAAAQYGEALESLLKAVDSLRKITSVDISAYRLTLDSLLQETAWNWLRAGGDKAASDAQQHDQEKDAQHPEQNAPRQAANK